MCPLGVRCLLAGFLSFLWLASVQADDKPLTAKGQVKVGFQSYKMEAGKLYQIKVEGNGFRPNVLLRPGSFVQAARLEQGDTFQSYFMPKDTKDHRLIILPDGSDDLDGSAYDYTLTVTPITLAAKPLLQEKSKLAATDPLYKNDEGGPRDAHFKAFPLKMKARQFYVIDMVRAGGPLDPYLILEGPGGKIVATDDDSGGNNNARIIFQPRREGDHRIIATSLSKATGEFTLTVRTEAKEKE